VAEYGPVGELLGRASETERLGQVIAAARRGRSGVLVVRGEPGVGKTALLAHAVDTGTGLRVLRAVGVESEMELGFAALQQLCAPVLDRLDGLPGPQAGALRTAFGLCAGDPPDRLLVGLATLSLLSVLGSEQPLVCLVDDAQWLDQASAQTLAFVARRLLADPVAMLFASRVELENFAGFPELMLKGLGDRESRVLLESLMPFALDGDVRERIVAETRGNPLALLELPRGLSPAQLAGGFALPAAGSVPARIEESFRRRLEALPPDTRDLLLVAAAEPVGNAVVVLHAAQALGIRPATAAEFDGLLEIGARVTFRHPLVRSAVYQAASPESRRRAHRALAEAIVAGVDPDRRAWHRAHATAEPDEEVASELERSAGRAQARGGFAAAAAFLERAAGLTLDPKSRARRALVAAESKHLAGAPDAALSVLAAAEAGPLDELQRARADLLRAEIAYTQRRGNDAPQLLLRAANRLEPLDVRAARDTYLDAMPRRADRSGGPSRALERASDALRRLSEMTTATGTDWGAGIRVRSEASLSANDKAEPLYQEAVDRLGRSRIRPQAARTCCTANRCVARTVSTAREK
jgi:hypothetical protein